LPPLSPRHFFGEGKKEATRSFSQVDEKKVCLEDDHGSTNTIIEAMDESSQGVISHVARASAERSSIRGARDSSGGSCGLARMAEEISLQEMSEAKMPSIERRLQRFIANSRIDVLVCWKAFLEQVLPFWQNKEVVLVLDCTPFRSTFTIVYLGLLVHRRVLPLAWKIMPQQESWEQGQWQLVRELVAQVAPHFPPANCTLIADRGLACLELIRIWKASQVALCLADRLRTPGSPSVQAKLVLLARWRTVHHTRRSTVVRFGFDLERAQRTPLLWPSAGNQVTKRSGS
jgi:hypothetical protein